MRDSPFHKGSGQGAAAAQRAPAGASNLGKKPAAAKPPAKKKAAASDSESDVSCGCAFLRLVQRGLVDLRAAPLHGSLPGLLALPTYLLY